MQGIAILLLILVVASAVPKGRKKGACAEVPLLGAALENMPEELQFPCDEGHLSVIQDIGKFLKAHVEVAGNARLRWKAEHAIAFTVGPSWPVYVNLSSHRALTDAYARGVSWVSLVFAGVLAHERVHAMGDLSEAAGLWAEYSLDARFRKEGRLPNGFDLAGIERQWQAASVEETSIR